MSYAHTSATQRQFLPPAVAVSSVAFALHPPGHANVQDLPERHAHPTPAAVTLWIPLVRRNRPPFIGSWALPGGPIPWDEALADTALRTLHAAVELAPSYLEQLYAFGARERSADAQRLVTIAYWALYGEIDLIQPLTQPAAPATHAGGSAVRWDDPRPTLKRTEKETSAKTDGAPQVMWFSADALPDLAFDHSEIVATALWRLRSKTEYADVAHRFLGDTFTLAQLREVHEAIRGARVDPANFRRQILAQGTLTDTGEKTIGVGHRPARLYRFAGSHSQQTPLLHQPLAPQRSNS